MSHTPGPWHVGECGHYEWCVRGPDGPPNIPGGMPTERYVARECPSVEDANLVAAAPDLIVALEWLLAEFREYQDHPDRADTWPEAMLQAEWAIKKSRGKL